VQWKEYLLRLVDAGSLINYSKGLLHIDDAVRLFPNVAIDDSCYSGLLLASNENSYSIMTLLQGECSELQSVRVL
jgi:hypothetical protein